MRRDVAGRDAPSTNSDAGWTFTVQVGVGTDGSPGNGNNADVSLSVVPGFCI